MIHTTKIIGADVVRGIRCHGAVYPISYNPAMKTLSDTEHAWGGVVRRMDTQRGGWNASVLRCEGREYFDNVALYSFIRISPSRSGAGWSVLRGHF
jgi:hypothetical protein